MAGCSPSGPSADERQALILSNTDAARSVIISDSLIRETADSNRIARMAAVRSFARYRATYDDTVDDFLDTAAIIRLRAQGEMGLPYLIRGLFAYGNMAYNGARYQSALNLMGECGDRALTQAHDTFMAARAYEALGMIYRRNRQVRHIISVYSRAANLYEAIDDRYNRDYARMRIADVKGIAYDSKLRKEGIAILDSLESETHGDTAYRDELKLPYFNLEPRLQNGQYDMAIAYGREVLRNPESTPDDSLWAYGHISQALIRKRELTQARAYLDSARRYEHRISRRGNKGVVSLTRTELDLLDSMARDGLIKRVGTLISGYAAERDTFAAMIGEYPGDVVPIYTMEFPKEGNPIVIYLIILLGVAVAAIVVSVWQLSQKRSLERRQKTLKRDFANVSRHAQKLDDELHRTLADYRELENLLADQKVNNKMIASALAEQWKVAAEKDRMIADVMARMNSMNVAASTHGCRCPETLSILLRDTNKIINRIFRLAIDVEADGFSKPALAEMKSVAELLSSDELTDMLELEMQCRFAEWDSIRAALGKLLSDVDIKILMMLLAGFDITVICRAVGLRKSAVYRHRDDICTALENSVDNSAKQLSNKIITK